MNDDSQSPRGGTNTATPPVKAQMARGIAWMTGARLVVQLLGLLSTLVLARLLTPADFGLIALAMSVVTLLETLSAFNFDTPLIHKRDTTREDFDTAWTLNIILALILAVLIVLAAPAAVRYYSEPRLEAILYCVAGAHVVLAFQNIGTVVFRKDLDFRRDFLLQVSQKLAMLAVGIPLAFVLRSYWALVIAMVAGRIVQVVISFLFLPYRPRICLSSWRGLLSYSKWLQVSGVMSYIRDRGYILIMGRALDPAAIGLFSLADEIGTLPSTTLVAPLNRAVFPGFARLAQDASSLRDGYKSMLGLSTMFALPAALGLAAVSALVVPFALGPQWSEAVPLLTLLALAGASRTLTASTISVHYALGHPQTQTLTMGIQALTLLPVVALGVHLRGVTGVAWAYFLHSLLLFVPVSYWILLRTTPLRFPDVWEPVWRPLLASVALFAIIKPLADAWSTADATMAFARLLVVVVLGAVMYFLTIALLWLISGRPEGTEAALLRRLREALPRLTRGGHN